MNKFEIPGFENSMLAYALMIKKADKVVKNNKKQNKSFANSFKNIFFEEVENNE